MQAERKRLVRLQRLEKVRAVAKQAAASEAARAESTLAQLEALAERTGRLVADYSGRIDAADGLALMQQGRFAGGLQGIRAGTLADAGRARTVADARQAELAMAERSRAAVEERAAREVRDLAAKAQSPVLGTRKPLGTPLE
ncbi:MAG: hypothetical protein KGL44_01965 [Sphingomonadales bacterium]|nr:hypothetical protein [Sphingomonadales bacterium]